MESEFRGYKIYITLLLNVKVAALESLARDYPNNICFINPRNVRSSV